MSTVFSKIISRDIPADIVYEDDAVIAFLDINPIHKGHTLVIPKDEYVWFLDLPDELIHPLFSVSQKIARALKKATGAYLVQLSIVGDEVPHTHIHLIPRYKDDGLNGWDTTKYAEGEAATYAEKIRTEL